MGYEEKNDETKKRKKIHAQMHVGKEKKRRTSQVHAKEREKEIMDASWSMKKKKKKGRRDSPYPKEK